MTHTYSPFLFEHIETMPREQLQVLQTTRLLQVIKQAYQNSPLIQTHWDQAGVHPRDIQTLEDFQQKAPFFDKDAIRHYRDAHNDPCGGLIRLDNPRLTAIATTSGTTGDPTPMPRRFRTSSEEGYIRDHWHIGARPGDYVIMPVFTFRAGASNGLSAMNEAGLTPIVFSHHGGEIPRIVEAIERYRPTVCGLLSSPMLIGFEQYFAKTGLDPREVFKSFKGSIYGGEALSPRMKAMTESWGLELFETTALGDVVSATQCRAHDGFHAYEDLAMVECVDPLTDLPVPDGQVGELVVTNINDPLLAMVRFRTDDLVIVNRQPCSCGRTHLRYHIVGRKSDQLVVQGRSILPRDIRFIVEQQPESTASLFQIIKSSAQMDVLTVRVGYDPVKLTAGADEFIARLEALIAAELGVPVAVTLTLNDELLKLGPPHKIPRVAKQ
jgi:phenylacetate-CoA ligase